MHINLNYGVAHDCSFTSLSRAWHTFCPDTIFVGLTLKSARKIRKQIVGAFFASFEGVERTRNVTY